MALFWFRRDQSERHKSISTDRDAMAPTYDQWLHLAERVRKREQERGVRVIIVEPHVDDFAAWCASHGLDVDSKARVRLASERAAAIVRGIDN